MSAERWQRLRDAYDAASSAAPVDRQRLLEDLHASDPALARELRALLEADAAPDHFLDTPIARLAPPEFEPGAVLCDRFAIREQIGRGGMGEVWAAFDRHLNEEVAIKTIRASPGAGGDLLRFKREIQLARRIAHPNVCRVHELFEDANVTPSRWFLTMERLEGETLAARLKRDGAVPPAEAIALAKEIAGGVAAAHVAGVVHRDLKPANVMLLSGSSSRRVAIMDFGLARSDGPRVDGGDGTASGLLVGTPEYMAPEQIAGGEVTPATDVYALGLILFEMLRGARPFAAGSTLESWMRRAREGPERLSGVVPGLEARIDQVIARCLEYEPERRFASARDLSDALTSTPFVTLPVSPRRLGWVAAAVLVVGALAGLGVWLGARVPPPTPAALEAYENALESLAESAVGRAFNQIQRAISLSPRFAPFHAALAEINLELDMPSRAQQAMLNASEMLTERTRLSVADRRYVEGIRFLLLFDCDAAIRALTERADASDPAMRPLRMVSSARAMERCDRIPEALGELTEAAKLNPRSAAVQLRTARISARASDYLIARGALNRAEELFKDEVNSEGIAEVVALRGQFHVEQNEFDQAEAVLKRAAGMADTLEDPRLQIRVMLQEAIALRKRGQFEGAGARLDKALEMARLRDLETLTVETLLNFGGVHLTANRFDEAEDYFRRATNIAEESAHPEYQARAAFSRASLLLRTMRPTDAMPLASAAAAFFERVRHPRNLATARMLVGQIHVMRGEYSQAITEQETTLAAVLTAKDSDQEASARENLATALAAAGRYSEALRELHAALKIHRSSRRRSMSFALLNIADVASKLGRFPEAVEALAEVRRGGGHSPDMRAQILLVAADVELRRGRYAAALSLARESVTAGEGLSLERTLRARLTMCLASIRSFRRMGRADCQDILKDERIRENHGLLQETRLAVAEAFIVTGRRADAMPLLADAGRRLSPHSPSEERVRYYALSTAAFATPQTELTREADGLRLTWQPDLYRSWSSRSDVTWWFALASRVENTSL